MELKLYDTLTREKRVFTPLDPANVRMYVCGPTVYDFAHIGNARPVIVFDVLFRLLRHLAKQGVWDNGRGETKVTYVRNITDVDDKITARAVRDYPGLQLNEAIRKVTEVTEVQFQADVKALGCLPPTHQPRATEFVLPRRDGRTDMKSLIQELLYRHNAYVAEGSEGKEVLFDVSSMPDYGALSGSKLEDLKAGARIAVDAHKKNPGDFVLWKESGAKEPGWKGEYEFVPDPRSGYDAEFVISSENASRLGRNSRRITIHGRPGWHIECSAMSAAYLGHVFDIHGGGLDLIFPHHENEIAQSRCAFHTPVMANYWMHNGFLQVEGGKMSKSLGNFLTIRDALQQSNDARWGDVLRLNMLRTQYRQPIDWTKEGLAESAVAYASFRRAAINADRTKARPSWAVIEALSDDLNTPAVLAELHRLAHNAMATTGAPADAAAELVGSLLLLGFDRAVDHVSAGHLREDIAAAFEEVSAREKGLDPVLIKARVADRIAARKAKNFAESDRIRDELARMGVVLKDSKDGTTWEIAR